MGWHTKSCPLFLYGICAGAYHSAHALIKESRNEVVGLIFDSGWTHVKELPYGTLRSEITKNTKKIVRSILGSSTCAQLVQTGAAGITNVTSWVIATSVVQPILLTQKNLNLLDYIDQIKVPIFYIHSYDDTYTDISLVKALAEKSNDYLAWWIRTESTHAFHHLKKPEQYRDKLETFITTTLTAQS